LLTIGVQLLQRLRLGLRVHPVQRLDVVGHRLLDLRGHVQRALLQLGAEGARDELLAERLAQLVVDQRHAALPARLSCGTPRRVLLKKSKSALTNRATGTAPVRAARASAGSSSAPQVGSAMRASTAW
jgi:hypothetical protein